MNKDIKVSIIIPCYNCEKYIEDSINSAINQTFKDVEIICVNDGSTDNSAGIIEKIASDYPCIKFINNTTNKGVVAVRNMAIALANGEYILPLDADDIIEPTYIEKAMKVLDNNPEVGIVYCKARLFGEKEQYWDLKPATKENMLSQNRIFATSMFRKSDFLKVGCYKEYMNNGCEDWDLWLSFFDLGLKAYRIDEVLFNYRKPREKTRTDSCMKYIDDVRREILKHHYEMYIMSDDIIKRIFGFEYDDFDKVRGKYRKYKKSFNILLILFVLTLVVILVFILKFMGRIV